MKANVMDKNSLDERMRGRRVVITSKAQKQYVGFLAVVDRERLTVTMNDVRALNDDGKATGESVYEYVVFKATDVLNIDLIHDDDTLTHADPAVVRAGPLKEHETVHTPSPPPRTSMSHAMPHAYAGYQQPYAMMGGAAMGYGSPYAPVSRDWHGMYGSPGGRAMRRPSGASRATAGGGRVGRQPEARTLRFDLDYDLEEANKEGEVVLHGHRHDDTENAPPDAPSEKPDERDFYNKEKSFFDAISTDAEQREQMMNAPHPPVRGFMRKLNMQTFGAQAIDDFYELQRAREAKRERRYSMSGGNGGHMGAMHMAPAWASMRAAQSHWAPMMPQPHMPMPYHHMQHAPSYNDWQYPAKPMAMPTAQSMAEGKRAVQTAEYMLATIPSNRQRMVRPARK